MKTSNGWLAGFDKSAQNRGFLHVHTCGLLMRFFAVFVFVCISCVEKKACAEALDLDVALQNTYRACVGIDESLAELKKLAGINTAVTAVGTAAGGSATVVGLVKSKKDKQIAELEKRLEKLKSIEEKHGMNLPDKDSLLAGLEHYYQENKDESKEITDDIAKLTDQSKKLGNWRTGLMAGATATNIAGAAIAGVSLKKGDIQNTINECNDSVSALRVSIARARIEGQDVTEAEAIVKACSGYIGQDVSKIQKQAKGSLISSLVGTATGISGTVTSGMANSDKIRDDNTDSGQAKEKNLNTASNILAGATTAASATATVFNAVQISTIKHVANAAVECEEALVK